MKNKLITIILIISAVLVLGVIILSKVDTKDISQVTEKIYVALEGAGQVAVIDAKTNRVINKVDLSENKNGTKVKYMPHNVQVAPDNRSVWITANVDHGEEMEMSAQVVSKVYANTEDDEDEVIVIDPISDEIIQRIELGVELHLSHVAVTPDSSYAIVASQEKGIIYKINTHTFEVEKEVNTKKDGGPHGLRIAPDGKTAYIAMLGGKSLGILDMESYTLKDVTLKGSVVQTGVTPDGTYALASVYETKSLAVYNTNTLELSYVDVPKESKGPVQLYPTPDSRYVYIADQGYYFDQPIGNRVYKVDLQEMKVVQDIKAGSAPHGVVISQDGKFVYITNLLSDDISVIDTTLGKEVKIIPVGDMPNGINIWYESNEEIKGNLLEIE